MTEKTHNIPANGQDASGLRILPVRNLILYPYQLTPILVLSTASSRLIDDSIMESGLIGVFLQKPHMDNAGTIDVPDIEKEKKVVITEKDIHRTGAMAKILKMVKLPNDSVRILAQGLFRCRITRFLRTGKPYLTADTEILKDVVTGSNEELALVRNISALFREIISYMPNYSEELQVLISNITEPEKLTDLIAANLNIPLKDKQKLLETPKVSRRAELIHIHLSKELELLKLGSKIQTQVKSKLDKKQREFFLRQELDAIRKELGESDETAGEIKELTDSAEKADLNPEVKKVVNRELKRMEKMQPGFAEYNVIRTYLEWLIELPWKKTTEDQLNVSAARARLDKDHYDLQDVKEVILDFLSVKKLRPEAKSNILCLVGPPGVGKTSLGRSIAATMGRKFIRMSLGGIHDEAEIRGHRKTYVGALPGRIIQGIRNAGTSNPVFMLDEVDKIGQDFRGDPSSALLEVLDPEQNSTFRDNYLEVDFDLSKVLFVTTANMLDTIPSPLLDRMEVVKLSGYTSEEKVIIAKRYLVPRQIKDNGLAGKKIKFSDSVLKKIVLDYTREAGVRNLEREIRTVCRKIARKVAEKKSFHASVRPEDVEAYLSRPRFKQDVKERIVQPGIAVGMAWTPVGGTILFIESTIMKGHDKLVLTGKLGEVMKESATIALNYIRANAEDLKVDEDIFSTKDIHIHFPEGATPKDGPSAGITIATSLLSLILNRRVRSDLAMTGELTLRGKILPIGGVKEKILAAKQSGIFNIILPKENRKDVEEIDSKILKRMKFNYVDSVDQVFQIALLKK